MSPRKRSNFFFSLSGTCLFLLSAYFSYQYILSRSDSIESSVQKILPGEESIQKIEKMSGGFSNDIWQVYTKDKKYILRKKANQKESASFIKDLEIAKKAFFYGIGPEIIGANINKQQMLIEYIESVPWPSYEENPTPYKKTMEILKVFHKKMPCETLLLQPSVYTPFEHILHLGGKLEKQGLVPTQFSLALKKTKQIFEELKPWLKNNAALCHGDFCKQNVLLSQDLDPILIDFDSASIGDPLFDVVKFSLSLFPEQRLELFQTYLGNRSPSIEELRHFELIDLTLLMLIATIRFNFAQNQSLEGTLSQTEMDLLLSSNKVLPSFLEISFEDASAKARQLGALYALSEFLRKTTDF